jgi:16S rRNA (uracil1498-N3)-methyltransferase
MMQLDMAEDMESFVNANPESKMLNFSEHKLGPQDHIATIVIGCEGGFHEDEVAIFKAENIIGLDTPLVLKSESAVCAVAGKILL